jgi:hypothetical protein
MTNPPDHIDPTIVENKIRSAFPRTPYATSDIQQPAQRREKASFIGLDWWMVEFAEAKKQGYLAFDFTNQEAVYYCPLMLLTWLHDDRIAGLDDYFDRFFFPLDEGLGEGTTWNTDPESTRRYNSEIFAFRELFDVRQKQAIACVFQFMANQRHDGAMAAVRDYWGQYLGDC